MDKLAMLGGTRVVPKSRKILPWPAVRPEDEQAVQLVLAGGRFTSASTGETEIAYLERQWAEHVGTRHCVAVSNGTAALSLALAALSMEPGDEVIVPALSFVASALAPLHVMTVPVFVDIDPYTYNLIPEAVEAAITPRTRAIVVVHLHGLPADMDEIDAIASRHGIAVIEDAAQAHGAEYHGRRVGSIGMINSFSLNVSKNLATCGEGGLVTTDDDILYRDTLMMRQFGEIIPARGQRSYVTHMLGWNHKPNAIQAAFTRSQLSRFDLECKARDANVRSLLERLSVLEGLSTPSVPEDRTHAWHILRFRVDPSAFGLPDGLAGALRGAVMRALRAEGVPVSSYQLMPLPGQRIFQDLLGFGGYPWALPGARTPSYAIEGFPNTLRVIEDSFTIQKAHLHPESGPLLILYAEAFEKVWQHRNTVARHAESASYQAPWTQAYDIAASEWATVTD